MVRELLYLIIILHCRPPSGLTGFNENSIQSKFLSSKCLLQPEQTQPQSALNSLELPSLLASVGEDVVLLEVVGDGVRQVLSQTERKDSLPDSASVVGPGRQFLAQVAALVKADSVQIICQKLLHSELPDWIKLSEDDK